MPAWLKKILAGSALTLIFVGTASASLLQYSFTDTAGQEVSRLPADAYANPVGAISFALSAGLDRRVRITLVDSMGRTVASKTSHLLGAVDRISVDGREHYGAHLTLSAPNEGVYTLRSEILSSGGEVIREETTSVTFDATRPTVTGAPFLKNSSGWVSQTPEVFGGTGTTFIEVQGVSDSNGISHAEFYARPAGGGPENSIPAVVDGSRIAVQGVPPSRLYSGNKIYHDVGFRIYDRASNFTEVEWRAFIDTTSSSEYGSQWEIVGVRKNASSPWIPYEKNMVPPSNPFQAAWGYRSDLIAGVNGGPDGLHVNGGNKDIADLSVIGNNPDFKGYYGWIDSFSDMNGASYRNVVKHTGSGFNIQYNTVIQGFDFSGLELSPRVTDMNYKVEGSDSWIRGYGQWLITNKPVRITGFNATVEPRAYEQKVSLRVIGDCIVPAGETTCETDASYLVGTTNGAYVHHSLTVADTRSGGLGSRHYTYLYTRWDTNPLILKDEKIEDDKISFIMRDEEACDTSNCYWSPSRAWVRLLDPNTKAEHTYKTGSFSRLNSKEWLVSFDTSGYPEGNWSIFIGAEDVFKNVTELPLVTGEYMDRTSPEVSITVEGEEVGSLDQFLVRVTDDYDPEPKLIDIRLEGGPANERVQLAWRGEGKNTFRLEYPIMFPSLEEGEEYTLTVSAQDGHQNVGVNSLTFVYSPSLIEVESGADGRVTIPAAPHAFKRNDGTPAFYSEPFTLSDGSIVSGVYDLFATLRADAPGGLYVDGVLVPPGQTVELNPYDFTASAGRVMLPLYPAVQGASGDYNLIVSSSAPNSPILLANVRAWSPKVTLSKATKEPSQVLSEQRINAAQGAGSFCPVTTSATLARGNDPLLSPVCLLEWETIPRGLKPVPVAGAPNEMTELQGRYLLSGEQRAVYNIYLFHSNGSRTLIHTGEDVTEVLPVSHSASFVHSLEGRTAMRAVEAINLTLTQTGAAPACEVTTNNALALSNATVGGPLTCLIEFTTIPEDLTLTRTSPPQIEGTMRTAGEHSIAWVASIYDEEGTKLLMEEKTSSITVVHPPVSTALSFTVNESSTADVTPTDSHPRAWANKSYSIVNEPAEGTLVPTSRGFIYTPRPGYVGADTFTYRVTDTSGMYAEGEAKVTVAKFNYPPTVQDETFTAKRNEVTLFPLNAEDKNEWDSHTYEIVQNPSPAGIRVSVVDGSLRVVPVDHWYGTAVLSYRARDLEGARSEAKTITVNIPLGGDAIKPAISFNDPSSCLAPGSLAGFEFLIEDYDSGVSKNDVKVQARFSDVTLDVPLALKNRSQVVSDEALEVAPRRYVVSPQLSSGSDIDLRLKAAFLEIESNGGRLPFEMVVTASDVSGNSASETFQFDPSQIDDDQAPTVSLSVGKDGTLMHHVSDLVLTVTDDRSGIHYEEVLATLSYDGEAIPLTFSQAYSQGSPSSNACYSRHPLKVEFRSHQSSLLEPDALSMLSRAYIEGKELTLTVNASDYAGNVNTKDFSFSFSPDVYKADEVVVPAVKFQFKDARNNPTISIKSEDVVWTHENSVRFIAVASMNKGAPIAINGQSLTPGQPVTLAPFSLMEGEVMSLDIRSDATGEGGEAEIMLIPLDSSARTIEIPVYSWVPEVSLAPKSKNPVQLFDRVNITARQTDSKACSLSVLPERASGSNKLRTPICLLTWELIPTDTFVLPNDPPEITGFIPEHGEQAVSWSVYFFDDQGERHLMVQGEDSIDVAPAADTLKLSVGSGLDNTYRIISNIAGGLKQDSGPRCSVITTSEDLAYDMSARNLPGCLISWEELPEGIYPEAWTDDPKFDGVFDIAEGDARFAWKVSSFSTTGERVEIMTGEQFVPLKDPPMPTISMDARRLIDGKMYAAPNKGGLVGNYTVEAVNAPMVVEVKESNQVIESDLAPAGFTDRLIYRSRILAKERPLWSVTPVEIDARYTALPDVGAQKQLDVVAVPDEDLRPEIEVSSAEVLNIDGLAIDTWIANPYQREEYSEDRMGQWEVRLLNYLSTSNQTELTDYVKIDSAGRAEFDIDLLAHETSFMRLMPQARLISPIPEYGREVMGGRPLYVTILRGEAIDSRIQARRVKGEAPLRFMGKLDLTSRLDYKALGDVVWEVRNVGGQEWSEVESTSTVTDRFQYQFDAGRYELRARVFNKNSEAEFTTEVVEIHAYNVPHITIDGPSNAFIDSDAKLRLNAVHKSEQVAEKDLVVEWSEDNGDTWVPGGVEYVLHRDEEVRVMMMVRVRMADSPADWDDANVTRRHRVAFRQVNPPRGSILGVRVIEEGKPVEWRGSARAPYPRMDVEIQGRFILPDGTVVEESEVEYLPTMDDAERDRSFIQYESWIVGYEDQGARSTVSRRVTVWQYEWPNWSMITRTSATQAPAEVSLRVRKPVGMGRYLEDVKYEWDIPNNATLGPIRTVDSRTLQIEKPGNYPVTVRISDGRGNFSEITEMIRIDPPDPWDVDFRMSMSNPDMRAPLSVRLSPAVRGGHPRDRIDKYRYSLNGALIGEGTRYSSVDLKEGSHELALEIISEFGHTVQSTKVIEVRPNTPPVCELEAKESRSHWRFFAHCTDETGRVRRHIWKVNGEQLTLSGSRISVSAREGGVFEVQMYAVDDGGAESNVLTWHGSIQGDQ